MSDFKIVERENPISIHAITWSMQRAEYWIEKYGNSKIFTDKGLTKDSFIIIKAEGK